MKKLIIILLVILLVGCNKSENNSFFNSEEVSSSQPEEVQMIKAKEPPDLIIKYNDKMFKGVQGTTSWAGGQEGYEADADPPPGLVMYQVEDIVAFENDTLEICIENEPTTYSLVIWHDHDEQEYVEMSQNKFTLPENDDYIVYSLSARFDQGLVHYAFSVHVLKDEPATSFVEKIVDDKVVFDDKMYDVNLSSVVSYEYDGLSLVKKLLESPEGDLLKSVDYRYYNGLNVEEKHYENDKMTRVRHSYVSNRLVKSVTLEDDKAIMIEECVYKDSVKESYLYDQDRKLLSSVKGTCDVFGNFVDYISYDSHDVIYASKASVFDQGALKAVKYTSPDSKSYHLYNNYGDVVYIYTLLPDKFFVELIEITYNENQLPIKESHYKFESEDIDTIRDYW